MDDLTRRLSVTIAEPVFRRLSGYSSLTGLKMPEATERVLIAGLDALNAPTPIEDQGRKGGLVYGQPAHGSSLLADAAAPAPTPPDR